MAQDNVLIAKEEKSRKELFLKDRLYTMKDQTYSKATQELLGKNKDFGREHVEVYNERPVLKMPAKDPVNSAAINYASLSKPQEALKKMAAKQSDSKMDTFLDEMRQQFLQTQSANVVPQSLMYRQTQLMESQVALLERNQTQMGEVINNILNQPQTGPSAGGAVKQSVFQDNRKMMLDMMAPMNQQLNEMRLLHENTKQCSGDLEKKIDELKRVLGMQAGQLAGGPLLSAPVC